MKTDYIVIKFLLCRDVISTFSASHTDSSCEVPSIAIVASSRFVSEAAVQVGVIVVR